MGGVSGVEPLSAAEEMELRSALTIERAQAARIVHRLFATLDAARTEVAAMREELRYRVEKAQVAQRHAEADRDAAAGSVRGLVSAAKFLIHAEWGDDFVPLGAASHWTDVADALAALDRVGVGEK